MSSAPSPWSYACTRVNSSSEERRIRTLPRRSPLVLFALSLPVRISRRTDSSEIVRCFATSRGRVARLQLHFSYSPATGLTVPDGPQLGACRRMLTGGLVESSGQRERRRSPS